MSPSLLDRLLVALQRITPARFIGRMIYHLSRCQVRWLKDLLIQGFCKLYDVDTDEAAKPVPAGYQSFNQFFIRELKPGSRPIDSAPDQLVSPADGRIAQLGQARAGQLIQAKGMHFSAADLLADEALATELADCHFATVYLAPYNYHRLHMPLDGTLEQTLFVPGLLYSVNERTARTVPSLYAVNERLVCQFNSPHGRFAMVLVGAMNVASISTAWGDEIPAPRDYRVVREHFSGTSAPSLSRGDYMGHFNMGSTVVLLGPAGLQGWHTDCAPGNVVRTGQTVGTLAPLSAKS